MLAELQSKFPIKGAVDFVQDKFPKAVLTHSSGHKAEVFLYGAHVASWSMPNGQPLFLMSDKAYFQAGKPIRGGIPLVWPQFGPGSEPMPAHGFARINSWEVLATTVSASGEVVLVLGLNSTPATEKIWPHAFSQELEIRLGKSLVLTWTIRNPGDKSFAFTNALHTYFAVADIRNTEIEGLAGLTYMDSLKNRERSTESNPLLGFTDQTDRIYVSAPELIKIHDKGNKRIISIRKSGMKDAVIWNPFAERAAQFADLGEGQWTKFVCVEPGNVAEPVVVEPGKEVRMVQELTYN